MLLLYQCSWHSAIATAKEALLEGLEMALLLLYRQPHMDPHFTMNSIHELPHSSSFTHFPIPGISLFQDLNAAL
jgi:hypothetical protein